MATAKKRKVAKKSSESKNSPKQKSSKSIAKYPRHNVEKALRIPRAIIEQNAGKDCSDRDAAKFSGVGFNGPFSVEISSAIKYGFLSRPTAGFVALTDRARQAIRPQKPDDEIEAYRQAVFTAPQISEVYAHYRGEYLPDGKFFENSLTDVFSVPADKIQEFIDIFVASLHSAHLVEKKDDKLRILDVTNSPNRDTTNLRKVNQQVKIQSGETCFVMMPFAPPIGDYFQKIYEPAIQKAGMRAIRADDDIFGTGKIIDQIWEGINSARVLVAELTSRNPNVFYELGLAHALEKPVVLVSSNEQDVPFDLTHIRVIYYDVSDPFWGQKLIEKIAENVISAITNPAEATFFKRASVG